MASGPYETRIIVRRPANPRRFSGNVVVEMLNPTSLSDVDIMWAADQSTSSMMVISGSESP
jgi:hypothetical protein